MCVICAIEQHWILTAQKMPKEDRCPFNVAGHYAVGASHTALMLGVIDADDLVPFQETLLQRLAPWTCDGEELIAREVEARERPLV